VGHPQSRSTSRLRLATWWRDRKDQPKDARASCSSQDVSGRCRRLGTCLHPPRPHVLAGVMLWCRWCTISAAQHSRPPLPTCRVSTYLIMDVFWYRGAQPAGRTGNGQHFMPSERPIVPNAASVLADVFSQHRLLCLHLKNSTEQQKSAWVGHKTYLHGRWRLQQLLHLAGRRWSKAPWSAHQLVRQWLCHWQWLPSLWLLPQNPKVLVR
jgi:hypothetical protein